MHRHGKKLLSVLLLGSLVLAPGCVSGELAEQLNSLLAEAAKDTAIAIGTAIVEHAVDSAL